VTVPGPNLVVSTLEAQRREARASMEAQATRDYPCPTCGAHAGVRCRFVTRQYVDTPGYKTKTRVEVRPKPCGPRTALAIRGLAGG
jgi:hypothetical protein